MSGRTRARFTASGGPAAPTITKTGEFDGDAVARVAPTTPRGPIGRYGVLVAVLVILAVAIAIAAASSRESVYAAQAEVFFPLNSDRAVGFLREDRRLSTQLSIIDSRELLAPIAQANGLEVDQLQDKVYPSLVGSTEVVRIEVRDPDPGVALQLTSQVLAAYLETARSVNVDPAEALIESEIARVETRLAELSEQLATPTTEPSVRQSALLSENQALLDELGGLRNQLVDARSRSAVEEPSAIAQPHILDGAVSPKLTQAGAAGALVGLIVAGVTVFALERRRRMSPSVEGIPAPGSAV